MATSQQPTFTDLTIPEVLEAGKKGTPIIDVREQIEIHNTGLIPGSINIPLGHLDEALNLSDDEFKARYTIPKPGKEDKIIMSCMSGNRSKKAINALQEKGYKNNNPFLSLIRFVELVQNLWNFTIFDGLFVCCGPIVVSLTWGLYPSKKKKKSFVN